MRDSRRAFKLPLLPFTGIVAAIVLSGCGPGEGVGALQRAKQEQEDAQAAIVTKGGNAIRRNYGRGEGWAVDLSSAAVDDDTLAQLDELQTITELNLSGAAITDEQMKSLASRPATGPLLKLDISNTPVTDAGLLAFAELPLIFQITVTGSKVSPAGIESFRQKHPRNKLGMATEITR